MSKVYKLSSVGKARLRRSYYFMLYISSAPALAFVLWLNSNRPPEQQLLYVLAALFTVVVLAVSIHRKAPQLLDGQYAVQYELGEDYVARRQADVPEYRLHRADVTHLSETARGLSLHTRARGRQLTIPRHLEPPDYEWIRSELSQWAPIKPIQPANQIFPLARVAILLVGLAVLMLSTAIWIVLPIGLLLFGYYLWVAQPLLTADGVDPRTRRNMWMMPVFVAFLTGMKVCVLTNAFVVFMEALASAGR